MQLTLNEAHDHARALLVEEFCRKCGLLIFLKPSGVWDLIYREQDNTRVCIHDGGFDTAGHEPARIDWPETVAEVLQDAGRLSLVEALEAAERDVSVYRSWVGHPEFDSAVDVYWPETIGGGRLPLEAATFEARWIADNVIGEDAIDWPSPHLTPGELARVYELPGAPKMVPWLEDPATGTVGWVYCGQPVPTVTREPAAVGRLPEDARDTLAGQLVPGPAGEELLRPALLAVFAGEAADVLEALRRAQIVVRTNTYEIELPAGYEWFGFRIAHAVIAAFAESGKSRVAVDVDSNGIVVNY